MKKLQIVTGPKLPTAQTKVKKAHKIFMNILFQFIALYLFMMTFNLNHYFIKLDC